MPPPNLSQFAAQLKSRISPPFKQALLEPHPLCGLDFCPTNCHVNIMEVSYPKTTPSVGRSFSIRFGRKPSLIGLDPEQGNCMCPSKMCSGLIVQYLNRAYLKANRLELERWLYGHHRSRFLLSFYAPISKCCFYPERCLMV